MSELKDIIAYNLMNLRKANKLTQLDLAEKLNYSDKAISKWERGESFPDILVLKQLADMYNVSIDYILTEHTEEEATKYKMPKQGPNNRLIITLLSALTVWLLACVLYVNLNLILGHNYWMIWIWACPICSIIFVIFSSIWGHRHHFLMSITALIWFTIISFYLQFLRYNLWSLFLIGIPLEIASILAVKLKRHTRKQ